MKGGVDKNLKSNWLIVEVLPENAHVKDISIGKIGDTYVFYLLQTTT